MRRHVFRTTVCVALLLGPALAVHAGDDPTSSDLANALPTPTLHGTLELSLADAIAMGLENNLNVEIVRHDPLIAYEDSRLAWAPYDPAWTTDFGYSDDRTPNANFLFMTDELSREILGGSGGITALVPWLNTVVTTEINTAETRTNAAINTLSPEFATGLKVVARQPLLRGLIWNETWTQLKISGVIYQGSLDEFRRNLMDTVQAIENAYWTLIANEERVRVAQQSVELATALLGQVTTQYEVGVVSKVEIAEAEAGLASNEFDLITAQNRYQNTMDEAIDLILGPHLTADSRIQIEPTDRPDEFVSYDVDVRQAAAIAMLHRPELALAQREIERLEINLKFAKNRRLPQLDIEGRYGHAGLAGNQNPVGGVGDPQFFGDWQNSFEPFSNSFGVRGILTVPLGNVEGRHSVSMAQLELRKAHVRRRRVEQDVLLEVRRAARDLASSQEGIEAAERRQAAAAEQLRAEQIRLEYGESTPFDVLLRQTDLISAQQEYIGAFQVYRISVTGLDRSQGTILRNRNVDIEDVARLR